MLENELRELVKRVQRQKCETQTIEIKAAANGCPKVYDTLSSFSNQSDGGTILFGIDESSNYDVVGVYDAQKLQAGISEMSTEMEPKVRPIMSVCTCEDGKTVVAAEIPPMDLAERPCFKRAAGRLNGSYVRVGDSDRRMTEYEIYAFEAYRKTIRDDIRELERQDTGLLDMEQVEDYLRLRMRGRANIAQVDRARQMEFVELTLNGRLTLMALLVLGVYPQGIYPQLCINACRVPGTQIGEVDADGSRFSDSRRLDGTLAQMLEDSVAFVEANMRTAIGVSQETGKRFDIPEYPIEAVREALLNALIHRDYSRYTEAMPIQLQMFTDRLEVRSPGGLYGRTKLADLGSVRPETRNPGLVTAMETLGYTENRYSGIPRIRRLMHEAGLPEPVFESERGEFVVRLYNSSSALNALVPESKRAGRNSTITSQEALLSFCSESKSRKEIAQFLGISSQAYAMQRYVAPLVEEGLLEMTIPDKPRSSRQRYRARVS